MLFRSDELFRTIDSISEQMRVKRLALDKLVKAEKENRRAEIVRNASLAMNQHVAKLNERVGGNRMPIWSMKIFNDAVKGLKSLDSMRDKVNTALANAKIGANEIADRIDANRKALGRDGNADVWMFLFPDFAAVCTKAPDDFGALLTARIAKHNEAEAARIAQAKAAEDARIAAAVEAERKAGEARAAAAIESERMAAARLAAEQSAEVQRGKTDEARPSSPQASALYETASVSTPPTPEQKRAVVILAQDVIAEFLNSRTFGATPVSTIRAVLVEFVKFQSQNEMREAT